MRADRSVEPTKSQNSTVSCRRSESDEGAMATGAFTPDFPAVSEYPQSQQKRALRGFEYPQRGHALSIAAPQPLQADASTAFSIRHAAQRHRRGQPAAAAPPLRRALPARSLCGDVPQDPRKSKVSGFPSPDSSALAPVVPCCRSTAGRALVLGRRHVHPANAPPSESGLRVSVAPVIPMEKRGPPRSLGRPDVARAGVDRRMLSGRRVCIRPRPSSVGASWPSGKRAPSAPGLFIDFVAAFPTAHALARLRFVGFVAASVARLATGSGGLTPFRAGFPPAGLTEFHDVIASIVPF